MFFKTRDGNGSGMGYTKSSSLTPKTVFNTALKVSVFGDFLVCIFPQSNLKNSEYGHFSRSATQSSRFSFFFIEDSREVKKCTDLEKFSILKLISSSFFQNFKHLFDIQIVSKIILEELDPVICNRWTKKISYTHISVFLKLKVPL